MSIAQESANFVCKLWSLLAAQLYQQIFQRLPVSRFALARVGSNYAARHSIAKESQFTRNLIQLSGSSPLTKAAS